MLYDCSILDCNISARGLHIEMVIWVAYCFTDDSCLSDLICLRARLFSLLLMFWETLRCACTRVCIHKQALARAPEPMTRDSNVTLLTHTSSPPSPLPTSVLLWPGHGLRVEAGQEETCRSPTLSRCFLAKGLAQAALAESPLEWIRSMPSTRRHTSPRRECSDPGYISASVGVEIIQKNERKNAHKGAISQSRHVWKQPNSFAKSSRDPSLTWYGEISRLEMPEGTWI